jgi:hypothetical protein
MYYLKKYNTHTTYNTFKNSDEFKTPHVALITEDKSVFYSKPPCIAGNIAYWNGTQIKNVPYQKYNTLLGVPIGIVVIPLKHDVYGQNSYSIISLKDMSCNTPTTGTLDNEPMCFSPSGDLANIPTYNVVVVENGSGGLTTNGFGYLSKNGKYAATSLHIPDPYLADMSRNPDYYNTSVSKYNCMADFQGKNNSDAVLNIRGIKDYTNWKPTYNKTTDYPAVSCCDMYFTEGTTQGDWYLPSAGEWGYVMSKWNNIQEAFNVLNEAHNNIFKTIENNTSYWTSTEHNSANVRYVHTDNGMGHMAKTTTGKVRAFLKIKV